MHESKKQEAPHNVTIGNSLNTPPEDFDIGCVIFCTRDPRAYEMEILSILLIWLICWESWCLVKNN